LLYRSNRFVQAVDAKETQCFGAPPYTLEVLVAISESRENRSPFEVNSAFSIAPELFSQLITADKYESSVIDYQGLMFRVACINCINDPAME
jgi:hypothetical protein